MFPVLLLLTVISFPGCQGAHQSRQMIERPEYARAAQKLIDTATALCKLDMLENEGIATLSANVPSVITRAKQKEIDNLSASYADSYIQTLKKIKKLPRQEIENEIGSICGFQEDWRKANGIRVVIMHHINEVYLGRPIAAKDVSQDFQALRYSHSLPNAGNGVQ